MKYILALLLFATPVQAARLKVWVTVQYSDKVPDVTEPLATCIERWDSVMRHKIKLMGMDEKHYPTRVPGYPIKQTTN